MSLRLTPYGNNAAIQIHLLSEKDMRKAGFTDYCEGRWAFYRDLWKDNISFNLSVSKNTPADWRIDILDENFLQPYDYQHLLTCLDPPEVAFIVQEKVEECMAYLASVGVLSGHSRGDYI